MFIKDDTPLGKAWEGDCADAFDAYAKARGLDLLQNTLLLKKVRERQEGYKKPGVKRREKKEEGIKNTRKRERERY